MTVTSVLNNILTEIDAKIISDGITFNSIQKLIELRAYIKQATASSSPGSGGGDGPLTVAKLDLINIALQSVISYVQNIPQTNATLANIEGLIQVLSNLDALLNNVNTYIIDYIPRIEGNIERIKSSTETIDINVDNINILLSNMESNLIDTRNAVLSVVDLSNAQIQKSDVLIQLGNLTVNRLDNIITAINTVIARLDSLLTLATARNLKLDNIVTSTAQTKAVLDTILITDNANAVRLDDTVNRISVLTPGTFTIPSNGVAVAVFGVAPTRKYLLIQNTGNANIWIGFNSTLTAANGILLPVNGSIKFTSGDLYTGSIWAIKTSGSGILSTVQG
jgi:hypothetical protein